jgi:transglutaminase-like putative cysteine protease
MRSDPVGRRQTGVKDQPSPFRASSFPTHAPSPQPPPVSHPPSSPRPTPLPTPTQSLVLSPMEGWLPLLLTAIALYCIVFGIISANWVSSDVALLTTSAIGLLLGLAVAKIPYFPQALLHMTACVIGYCIAYWFTSVITFHASPGALFFDIERAFTGQIGFESVQDSAMVFSFYLAFLCFFLGYFGCWLVYRAHLPWLVALVYCAIMLMNLNYVDASQHNVVLLLIIMLGAILLLVARMTIIAQITQWKQEGLYTDRAWIQSITGRCMQIACIFTLAALLCSWLLPMQTQPASGKLLWNQLNNEWATIFDVHSSQTNHGQEQAVNDIFAKNLKITNTVTLPGGDLLTYTSSDHQSHYLEGFTYNLYDGHSWTSSANTFKTTVQPKKNLPSDPLDDSNETTVTTNVKMLQTLNEEQNYIFAPSQPLSFSVPVLVTRDHIDGATSAWIDQQGSLTTNASYQVTSTSPALDPDSLSAIPLPAENINPWSSDSYYSQSGSLYLTLPKDLSPQVARTTSDWTSGATSAYQALQQLADHLSNTAQFKYSLDNPPLPKNEDVVDVLLQTKSGYCTYYATTMAVMGRQLGIPTRVVNGFSSGHATPTTQGWTVSGTDAHAWVQAYIPGYGWLNFDPTPGFSLSNSHQTQTKIPAATPKPQPTKTVAHPTPPKSTPKHSASNNTSATASNFLLFGSLAMVLLLCTIALFVAYTRKRRNQLQALPIDPASFFLRLCRTAARFGLGPRSWQTPYEYSAMLGQQMPAYTGFFWRVAHLFVRNRWGTVTVQRTIKEQEAQALGQQWPHLYRALLISTMQRWLRRKP